MPNSKQQKANRIGRIAQMAASPAVERIPSEVGLGDVLVQRQPAGKNTLDPVGQSPPCFRHPAA
jgi:hypothetical protein